VTGYFTSNRIIRGRIHVNTKAIKFKLIKENNEDGVNDIGEIKGS
jgi:hypothetical protein